jgi:hypothetical protein
MAVCTRSGTVLWDQGFGQRVVHSYLQGDVLVGITPDLKVVVVGGAPTGEHTFYHLSDTAPHTMAGYLVKGAALEQRWSIILPKDELLVKVLTSSHVEYGHLPVTAKVCAV